MSEIEREFDWDDQIEKDGADFVLLPEGDYDFEVLSMERGRHGGSEKLPPCNKATLSIRITAEDGLETAIKHNLFLHSKCEGLLCAFFTAIGQRKQGEKISMNWNAVPGSRGRCKVKIRNWKSNNGNDMQSNEIAKFYEPEEGQKTAPQWKAGRFLMELRPYQEEAKAAIFEQWEKGNTRTLLVLPTGCGKTIVFSKVTEDCVRAGDRVLILAHRRELLQQAADKIAKTTGLGCATEKAEESCLGSWFRVVVGSVQTMMRESRLRQFAADYFHTIIIDEAHHCISDSYQNILKHFDQAKILGVTATPDRGDMKNLGSVFQSLAYEYTLPKAIRDGYLTPIKAQTIPLKLDLTGVGTQAGDFKTSDLGTALDPYLFQIADEMKKYCLDRKTVVFLPLVKTSQKFCDILQQKGFRAAEVNGNSQDRAEILKDFEADRYNVLCNSMLLTEGWDCPSVDCIVVLRPTKVRALYSQMVGRGTRLHPGKKHLLLLDFLWHTERHELCHPAHLICESDEVAKVMTQNLENAGFAMDLEEAKQEASKDVILQREESLANQLREMKNRKRKLVDPLQFELSIQAEDLSNYVPAFGWEMGPASEKQIASLEKMGIFPDEIENAGKAAKLLERLEKRRKEGLTTPKQIRFLESKGFNHVGTWQLGEAKNMIDRIAANGWKVPPSIQPGEYIPSISEGGEHEW